MGFTNIDELTMTDTEFQKFKKIIYEQVGINLLPHKKIMLQGRIKKRLKKLEIESFSEYYDIIQKDSKELIEMFNVVSTNKTEFFRENHHFEFLKEVIPEIINQNNKILISFVSFQETLFSKIFRISIFFKNSLL